MLLEIYESFRHENEQLAAATSPTEDSSTAETGPTAESDRVAVTKRATAAAKPATKTTTRTTNRRSPRNANPS